MSATNLRKTVGAWLLALALCALVPISSSAAQVQADTQFAATGQTTRDDADEGFDDWGLLGLLGLAGLLGRKRREVEVDVRPVGTTTRHT